MLLSLFGALWVRVITELPELEELEELEDITRLGGWWSDDRLSDTSLMFIAGFRSFTHIERFIITDESQ